MAHRNSMVSNATQTKYLELLLDFSNTGDPKNTQFGTMVVTHLIKSILQDSGYLISGIRWEVQKLWLAFFSSLKPRQNSVCEIQGISNACGGDK